MAGGCQDSAEKIANDSESSLQIWGRAAENKGVLQLGGRGVGSPLDEKVLFFHISLIWILC